MAMSAVATEKVRSRLSPGSGTAASPGQPAHWQSSPHWQLGPQVHLKYWEATQGWRATPSGPVQGLMTLSKRRYSF